MTYESLLRQWEQMAGDLVDRTNCLEVARTGCAPNYEVVSTQGAYRDRRLLQAAYHLGNARCGVRGELESARICIAHARNWRVSLAARMAFQDGDMARYCALTEQVFG